jgi:hypothetical protein
MTKFHVFFVFLLFTDCISCKPVSFQRKESIITGDGSLEGGQYRYFFDSTVSTFCDSVVMLGVGTGMTTEDYSLVSSAIVRGQPNLIVLVTDHSPDWLVKSSEKDYVRVTNAINDNLAIILPLCSNTRSHSPKILVGGHSASGGTAWRCLHQLNFLPHGFIGLDPFRIDPHDTSQDKRPRIPTINYGFTALTCGVSPDYAALASYEASGDWKRRILYRFDSSNVSALSHGSFTDHGCFGSICPAGYQADDVRSLVAKSVPIFLQSLSTGNFTKSAFNVLTQPNLTVELFANGDNLPEYIGPMSSIIN